MSDKEAQDGYKILMFLRGKMTVELPCRDRKDAEELLTQLTTPGIIERVDDKVPEKEKPVADCLLEFDAAEMWKDGKLIARGLKPNS